MAPRIAVPRAPLPRQSRLPPRYQTQPRLRHRPRPTTDLPPRRWWHLAADIPAPAPVVTPPVDIPAPAPLVTPPPPDNGPPADPGPPPAARPASRTDRHRECRSAAVVAAAGSPTRAAPTTTVAAVATASASTAEAADVAHRRRCACLRTTWCRASANDAARISTACRRPTLTLAWC
jgi:hypothetical protein